MRTVERKLQQNLTRIEDWATNNGFKFSKSKTQSFLSHIKYLKAKSLKALNLLKVLAHTSWGS